MDMVIPGSEMFNSRPREPEDLRARISPKVQLHTVEREQVAAIDPLTYEVIRHRLWAITEEMGETLKRMSGSHAVTEANDFDFTICDELGAEVQVGLYNTGLVGSMDLAIYWTLENRGDNPGIEEGDMFLCNDPWIGGGLHQNDAAVLAPIFHDGKLFAWATAICHQLDLGGSAPGSWSPKATDVFSESVPTPPIKVVRGGELQQDVADAWVRRSRLPLLVGLDLRAKIGANTIAHDRIIALVEKYGADAVKAVMKRMMDDAEQRLRGKLRNLPDGTWHAVGYQEQSHEGDREVHQIRLAMTKRDDRLVFDFTGTGPQAGMINCPYPGLRAGIMFMTLPVLAGDIPWAPGGLLRCFEIVSEEGTLNNARFPAAVGKGPVGPAWATGNLVAECLSKMLDTEPEMRRQVQSVCAGTWDLCVLAGVDERPGFPLPFVGLVFDSMASGFGAQVEHDGVDTGGLVIIPQGRAPDAEMTEFLYPVLTLWRREETDSGGPGRKRGGLSGSITYIAHGSSVPMGLVSSGAGKAASQNVGLAGGYPGSTQLDLVFRGDTTRKLLAAGRVPGELSELGENREILPCEGESVLMPGDVVFVHWQGGGGYGDPLLRDPAEVVDDVTAFRVSPGAAKEVYGVVVRAGAVDGDATASLRESLRRERLGATDGDRLPAIAYGAADSDGNGARVDDNLFLVADGEKTSCRHCGHELGAPGTQTLAALHRREGPTALAGPQIWPHPETYVDTPIVFRQLCCPSCGTAISTAVVPADHPLTPDEPVAS
jgi:N-methylhydantoinase B